MGLIYKYTNTVNGKVYIGQTEIGRMFNIAKNTIGDISRGISWKEITSQFKLPIKRNCEENKVIYNSIYGIV